MDNISIKQLADELNTSKTTINKIIKKLGLQPQKQMINNQSRIVLNEVEISQIKADFGERHPQTTENKKPQTTETVGGNQPQTAENITETVVGNLQTSKTQDKALDILGKELDSKNERIRELEEQLAAAYKQISEQSRTIADLANKASYITAADKTAQIMDKQAAVAEQEQEQPKKSFWNRFLGR